MPMTVDLKDPEYKDGVITTNRGGLIRGKGIRLQAREFTYTKKADSDGDIHKVLAKGDLMLDYFGQIFVGDELEYDFNTKSGFLINGKTSIDIWFIGGKKITFFPDKSFEVLGASLTTSDSSENVEWEMTAERIHLSEDQYLSTKSIKFKFANVPVFWLPSFKSNLKYFSDHPVRYNISWDTGQGPKISMRYRVYSWKNFHVYLRGDYRYKRGPGGALEIDYKSDSKRVSFQSKNYLANDTFYNDDDPNKKRKRFRLQGIYKAKSASNKAEMELIYDRISDKNMPGDFKSDDFELNTAKQTRLLARYIDDFYIAGFNVEPRINSFQGFKQELPTIKMSFKPLRFGQFPLIMENRINVAFLDYVYSDDIKRVPRPVSRALEDFHSVRAETKQEFILPLEFYGVHFTPRGGFNGIIYSKNPQDRSVKQAVFKYGARLQTRFSRSFTRFKHVVIPYVDYTGLSKPSQDSEHVYIFDIQDGFHRLNQLQVGVDNLFYQKKLSSAFAPTFTFDPYALAFLGDQTFHTFIPKAGINFGWSYPSFNIKCHGRWNFNNQVLDIGNVILNYTYNANFALSLEYRHRSKYDWRKDNHDDFIVDVTRSIPNLLDSPMSDGRNTLLARAEIKIAPKWFCQIQTHQGWGRRNQPGYTEAKIDIFTMLSSAWRLRLSFMHTTRADQVGVGLDLINK
ncbi:MAG: LPS-assembly protein LptD [Chlamydiia bacterium]|nr:LPS-assembly protein LptD [Chlamydiia bacterium]